MKGEVDCWKLLEIIPDIICGRGVIPTLTFRVLKYLTFVEMPHVQMSRIVWKWMKNFDVLRFLSSRLENLTTSENNDLILAYWKPEHILPSIQNSSVKNKWCTWVDYTVYRDNIAICPHLVISFRRQYISHGPSTTDFLTFRRGCLNLNTVNANF